MLAGMQRLTLDRCCVISAAEGPAAGMPVLELIALAEQGEVDLALTTAFDMELPTADAAKAARLSAFLSGCPVLGDTRVAGPFILGFSTLGTDYLSEPEAGPDWEAIRAILRPGSRPNEPVWAEEEAEPERRRKYRQAIDGIHLLGHKLAGRDLFVTNDRELLRRADRLQDELGIRVSTPARALQECSPPA